MKKLLSILFTFFLMSGIWSCGARKVEKNRTKESTKTELTDKSKTDKSEVDQTKAETNIKKTELVTVDDQNQITTIEEVLEPLDSSKEAAYTDDSGKKQILNNAKKTTKTIIENNNTKTDVNTKTEGFAKSESQLNKKESTANNIKYNTNSKKAVELIHIKRDAWSPWNWLWLIIPIGVCYWVWDKYKDKIWFV
jgi:FtsZ-interacting cell division protein ZipA